MKKAAYAGDSVRGFFCLLAGKCMTISCSMAKSTFRVVRSNSHVTRVISTGMRIFEISRRGGAKSMVAISKNLCYT